MNASLPKTMEASIKKIIPDADGIMHCLFCVNDHGQKKVLRNIGPDIEVTYIREDLWQGKLIAYIIACLWKSCVVSRTKFYFLELNNIEQSLAGVNLCSKHILLNDPNTQCCITYTYTASCCYDKKKNWVITTLLIINLSQVIKTGFSVSHSVLCTTANAYSPCFKFPICVLVYEQFTFHCLRWLHVYKIKASLEETNGYSKYYCSSSLSPDVIRPFFSQAAFHLLCCKFKEPVLDNLCIIRPDEGPILKVSSFQIFHVVIRPLSNFHVSLSHWCSTTVSLQTINLFSVKLCHTERPVLETSPNAWDIKSPLETCQCCFLCCSC